MNAISKTPVPLGSPSLIRAVKVITGNVARVGLDAFCKTFVWLEVNVPEAATGEIAEKILASVRGDQ